MIHRYKRELSVAAAYILLLIVLAFAAPAFYKDQLRAILVSNAYVLVAAVGMTLVILCRQIDISIGSQLSICAIVAALLTRSGVPVPLVAIITILAGTLMGSINGYLIGWLGMPSIVVTLATMTIFGGSLSWIRQGASVNDLTGFQWFGLGQSAGQWAIVLLALLVFFLFAWALRNLAAGRAVYAVGSDQEAARLAGIRPRRVTFAVFATMGALTAIAALLTAVQMPQVDSDTGKGLELKVIAAVVVGGVAISGGRGTLFGTIIGVLFLGTVGPALAFLGQPTYWEKAIQGAVILLAVATDALRGKE